MNKSNYAYYISHSSSVNYLNTRFEDASPSKLFYDTLIIDNRITIDTFHVQQSNHKISIGTSDYTNSGERRKLMYSLSLLNQNNSILQYYKKLDQLFYYTLQKNNYVNNISQFSLGYLMKSWSSQITGAYTLTGYNKGDANLQLTSLYAVRDTLGKAKHKLFASAEFSSKRPEYFRSFYTSNSFLWNNEFKKQQSASFTLNYYHTKIKLRAEAALHIINNFLYYDTLSVSRQTNSAISVSSFLLNKDFSLGHFHLNNRILFQHVSDKYYLRLPDLMLRHSLYYENYLFKKALVSFCI